MNDAENWLRSKGYQLINGEWFAPSRLPPAAGHQPDPGHEPVAQSPRKIADAVRRFVRVKSYRCRLVDRDGVWIKYLIDALRYAGIIFEDSTPWLQIEVQQEEVDDPRLERTEVTII